MTASGAQRTPRSPSSGRSGTLMLSTTPKGSGLCTSRSAARSATCAAVSKYAASIRQQDTATAGYPSSAASCAAATVPEYSVSVPRLAPWFTPESTASGAGNRLPSARRTQSTGVPLTA